MNDFSTMVNKFNITFIKQNIKKHLVVFGGCQVHGMPFTANWISRNATFVTLERMALKSANTSEVVAPYHPKNIYIIKIKRNNYKKNKIK
jgi:hypothetical protein